MTTKVLVGGGFDPCHIGHIRHFKKAKSLTTDAILIVCVNPDEHMIKKKGYCFMPLRERMEIIKEFRCVDKVVVNIDKDGTCAESLRHYKPDIFAKGGDRVPGNLPQNEIDVCKELGIKIIYGVGGQLNSSSKLVASAARAIDKHR